VNLGRLASGYLEANAAGQCVCADSQISVHYLCVDFPEAEAGARRYKERSDAGPSDRD